MSPRGRRDARAVVAVAVLVALAGCGGAVAPPSGGATAAPTPSTATTSATATPSDDGPATGRNGTAPGTGRDADGNGTATTAPPDVEVRNGSLPVDAGRVFAGVRRVLGANVSPPAYVRVVDDPADLAPGTGADGRTPRFWRLVGLEPERALSAAERDRLENGLTTGLGGIVVYPGREPTAAGARRVLAHEYVHYVHVRQERTVAVRRILGDTTDGRYVARAVIEGAAVYATDAYLARSGSAVRNAPVYDRLRSMLPAGSPAAYRNSAYRFGHRYVAARATGPAALGPVFAEPPRTGEQVLHRLPPGAEPPAALAVAADAAPPWRAVGADRMGEAFVRAALANGVSRERAARAAAGWGNDTLRAFRSPEAVGFVWVLRWDDAADATEFRRTLRAYLDARGNRTGGRWHLGGTVAGVYGPDDRTVALVLGPAGFVDRTVVRAADGGDLVVEVRGG